MTHYTGYESYTTSQKFRHILDTEDISYVNMM